MDSHDVRNAIIAKREGRALPAGQWAEIVAGFLAGAVGEAELAALLMAALLQGLSADETHELTEAYLASGERLVAPDPRTLDKHSTGGVGDTATLLAVPLVAACGVPVAKLSGRALGHTGGTLDKLEAVAGVRTELSPERFFACVREVGCAIAAQSERLVPADARIYALRDRTATVPSRGLIAASIVSKKIAGGATAIFYDVKCGRGAFLHESDEAEALARSLVDLSVAFGRRARALVTDMDEPLGAAIGNGLEVIAARDLLRGSRRDERLLFVALADAEAMLALANVPEPAAALAAALASGRAAERFAALLAFLGAEPGALDAMRPHPQRTELRAPRDGFLGALDARALGRAARRLVDRSGPCAGIELRRSVGERVARGAVLAAVYGEPRDLPELALAFEIADEAPPPRPLVYGEIVSTGAARGRSPAASRSLEPRSRLETT
ncbi:MAG: thymidine phosphorylase [Vulcanimicrobiaceae bacterium]